MNTLQNVYDKLADKTELAKHEVELGLVDDLAKLLVRMKAVDLRQVVYRKGRVSKTRSRFSNYG